MAASLYPGKKKVTVIVQGSTPQRQLRRLAVSDTPTPQRRPPKKSEAEIRQVRERQQVMRDTPASSLPSDVHQLTPEDWWMSFNALDEHYAWHIVRRQVQTQLLKLEFMVCPVAFGIAAPYMTDLLTVFVKPLVKLRGDEHRRIVRSRFMRQMQQRLTGKLAPGHGVLLDPRDVVNEHDDPDGRLLLLGPAHRIGALTAMGRRRSRSVFTSQLQHMYRAMVEESRMGLSKSIDITFRNIQWSSVSVFGPREYQLRYRLIAAMRGAKDPINARPPGQLYIVHDVVWAESATIRLAIGDDVLERKVGRVNIGYKLAVYDRFSPTGMLYFPSNYADPNVFFDKMLSASHTNWVTPPPEIREEGSFDEEDGALKCEVMVDADSEEEVNTEGPKRRRFVRRRWPKKSRVLKPKLTPIGPSTSNGYGPLLTVPQPMRKSRRRRPKRLGKSLRPPAQRSQSASALLVRPARRRQSSYEEHSDLSAEPSYAELLFEPSRVSSAFDAIVEGTDFFSSAENMLGPVRNLPPF